MLATHCRSPDTFISWILSSVLHLLLPLTSVTSSTRSSLVVGVLTVIRNIVPHLSCDDSDQETLETLVQVYQVCVTLTSDKKDQNIVTTALETLVQVLRSPPPVLLYLLTSDAGLDPGHGSSMEESVVSVTRLSNHHHRSRQHPHHLYHHQTTNIRSNLQLIQSSTDQPTLLHHLQIPIHHL